MSRWIAVAPGEWVRRLGDSDVRLRDRCGWWAATRDAIGRGTGDTAREALEDLAVFAHGAQRQTLRRWAASLPPEIGGPR